MSPGKDGGLFPPGEYWLTDNYSDMHPASKPDYMFDHGRHFQAVWYSDYSWRDHTKKDRDNSVHASMVEISPTEIIVTEYTHSSEYDYDVPEEDRDPPHWKMQVTEFTPAWLYEKIIVQLRRASAAAAAAGTPAGRVRPPRGPEAIARWALTVGRAWMSHYGGQDDTSDSLP